MIKAAANIKIFRKHFLFPVLFLSFFLLLPCLRANAQTLVCHPGMTDLYDTPNGNIIARLSNNTPVTVREDQGPEGWDRIICGDSSAFLDGWVASADIDDTDPWSVQELRIGSEVYPCGNIKNIPLLAEPKEGAPVRKIWDRSVPYRLTVTGILCDDQWLLATLQEENRPVLWGFVPSNSVCLFMSAYVQAGKANAMINLRETPSKKGKIVGSYYSNATAEPLYSFEETYGWHRVNIGGVTGYMSGKYLETDAADGTGYRSPLLPLKNDSAPLYAASSGTETVNDLPSVTREDVFCILGKVGDRWHVRILTDDPDTDICGFLDADALKGKSPVCASLDATLTRETLLFDSAAGTDVKCKKGKKVRINAFYVQAPDQDGAIPLEYWQEGVNWVSVTVFLRGDYGYDEPYSGYVAVEALKFDKRLKLPEGMGVR